MKERERHMYRKGGANVIKALQNKEQHNVMM